jgi:CPA2 family monovalent cation:H+ antiporter-2
MAHPLISTIVIALALAWVFGTAAHRLRLPPLVGYLIAGVLIGPATPGFVADQTLASELAEIGVILLMFGVGLHFSLDQLLSVRAIAVPGAIAQIACATLLGMALGHWLGWSIGAGLVFGLALSVASTVVLLRALQERRLVETGRGRIAVGWLIIEDMVMVLTLVLLPAFAGVLGGEGGGTTDFAGVATAAALTIGKIAAFVAIMLIVGKRLIPWVLHYMAHTGSRELFRLAVFVIALGAAFAAAELFGVSFALGAFFAGMILSESPLSQRAAEETLPLRDAFAVIFFVSVGMLFKPAILIEDPLAVLATLAIILLGKSLAAFAIIRLFRYPASTALLVSVSLAQIGEFSFILAGLGVDLGLLPERGRNLILAGAILSILLNPLLFAGLDMLQAWRDKAKAEVKPVEPEEEGAAREPVRPTALNDHVVLVGHGRVGGVIRESLAEKKVPLLVIENDDERLAELKAQGIEAIAGNAADPEIIAAANLGAARCLLVAIPDAFEGGQVVEQARALSPKLSIIARAHSEAEVLHLKKHGASVVILSEHEMARAMVALVSTADA